MSSSGGNGGNSGNSGNSSSSPRWLQDPKSKEYYYYDATTDYIVYRSGRRVRRPANIPRSNFQSSASTRPADQSDFQGSSSTQAQYQYGSGQSQPTRQAASNQQNPYAAAAAAPSSPSAQHSVLNTQMASLAIANCGMPPPLAPRPPPPYPPGHEHARGVRSATYQDAATGLQITTTTNDGNGVRTLYSTAPKDRITDPFFLKMGMASSKYFIGTQGATEPFHQEFTMRKRTFYVVGRVFLILWSEPMGETVATAVTYADPPPAPCSACTDLGIKCDMGQPHCRQCIEGGQLCEPDTNHPTRFGQRVHSKMRRFVVIRQSRDYCSALAIKTYRRQGVSKPGVIKQEHSIIHVGSTAPEPLPAERPGRDENGMRRHSIRVVPDTVGDGLDDMSRLDYGKVYTIHTNLRVRAFGMVHQKSLKHLEQQAENVWKGIEERNEATASSSTQRRASAPTQIRPSLGKDARNASDSSDSSDEAVVSRAPQTRAGAARTTSQQSAGKSATQLSKAQIDARQAYANARKQGYTEKQAFDYLLTPYLKSMDRSKATAALRELLGMPKLGAAGKQATVANAESSSSSGDESEADDKSKASTYAGKGKGAA